MHAPSNNRLTPSANSLPIHRIANALRMWPWATSRTSLLCAASSSLGAPMAWAWKRVRMAWMRRSRRWVMSFGDLEVVGLTGSIEDPSFSGSVMKRGHLFVQEIDSKNCGRSEAVKQRPRYERKYVHTYSPPGHPSLQISHSPCPLSRLCSRICLLVKPS